MNSSLRDALFFLESRISQGVPCKIMTSVHDTMYILTDASFDDDKTGGLGGVLLNGEGSIVSWFPFMLSESQVQKFIRGDAQVVIGELEALAPVMAPGLWSHLCRSRHIIFYIDNDGARYSRIKGYSSSFSLSLRSRMLAIHLEELVCVQWFARHPVVRLMNCYRVISCVMLQLRYVSLTNVPTNSLLTRSRSWGWVKWPTRPMGLSRLREDQRESCFMECHPTPT